MKKFIFAISAFVFAMFFASLAMAQFIPAVDHEELLKEPPLTQNDVEIYKKYHDLLYIWRTASDNDLAGKAADDLEKFVYESDFTTSRIHSAYGKIVYYIDVRNGKMNENEVEECYSTNEDEKRLLDKNFADLKAIDDKFANLK
jgi:hypothetical protein